MQFYTVVGIDADTYQRWAEYFWAGRASGSNPEGWGFDSSRPCHSTFDTNGAHLLDTQGGDAACPRWMSLMQRRRSSSKKQHRHPLSRISSNEGGSLGATGARLTSPAVQTAEFVIRLR